MIQAQPSSPHESDKPDLVIQGGMALTMVDDESPLQDAWISIQGGRIVEIRSGVKEGCS